MQVIFKCDQCATGPCYCGAAKPAKFHDGYQMDIEEPHLCPYYGRGSYPCWEPVFDKVNAELYDEVMEWFGKEGYEEVPEKIRDLIFSRMNQECSAVRIMDLLRELGKTYYDEDRKLIMKDLLKKNKQELIEGLLGSGFHAGILYVFRYMHENAKPKSVDEI